MADVITIAIDRMYSQEIKNMNAKLTDDQLNDITYGPGLYATSPEGYTAYARSDMDEEDGATYYSIAYCKEAMPPHYTSDFATIEELAIAMQATAPLDKWLSIELDDDEQTNDDE